MSTRIPARRTARALALATVALSLPLSLSVDAETATRFSLAQLIPATTVALVSIPDLAAAKTAFQSSEMGKFWRELQPFTDELVRGVEPAMNDLRGKFEHDSGLSLDDVLAGLGGGAEVAITKVDKRNEPAKEGLIALIREEGREAAVHTLLQRVQQMADREGASRPPSPDSGKAFVQDGVMVSPLGPTNERESELLWTAETRGALIIGGSKEIVAQAIQASCGKALGATLDQSPDYAAVRGHVIGAGTTVAMVYASVLPFVDEMVKGSERDASAAYQLGLRELRSVGLGIAIEGGRAGAAIYVHAPSKTATRGGVLGVLAQAPIDAASLAKLAPDDSTGFAAMTLDLGGVWDRSMTLFDALDKRASDDMRKELMRAERDLGFNVRRDLLGSFGADWAIAAFQPEGGGLPVAVISVGAPDGPRLEQTLAHLAELGGLEIRDVSRGGKTIHYMRARLGRLGQTDLRESEQQRLGAVAAVQAVLGSSWVVVDGRAYFADMPMTLEEYFLKARGEQGLAGTPAFQEALKCMQAGAQAFAYDDPRQLFPGMWNAVMRLGHSAEGFLRAFGIPVDHALMPRGATLGKCLTTGYSDLTIDQSGVALRTRPTLGGIDGGTAGVAAVAVIAAIAIPNLIEARKGSNEVAAIGALRTLNTAQSIFREGDKDQNGILDYAASLDMLHQYGNLIDPALASGVKQGYRFQILKADQLTWSATAIPLTPGKSGDRCFFIDESGVTRYSYTPEDLGPESTPIGG